MKTLHFRRKALRIFFILDHDMKLDVELTEHGHTDIDNK